MAAPTKAELIEALTKLNVTLTGEETVAELKTLIETNAEQVTDPDTVADLQKDPAAQEAAAAGKATAKKKGDVTRIVFHLNNIVTKTREFSQEVHGDEWQDIAEEFAVSNAKKIRSREDL